MPRGRPLVPLTLTDEQQEQLNGIGVGPIPWLLPARRMPVTAVITAASRNRRSRSR